MSKRVVIIDERDLGTSRRRGNPPFEGFHAIGSKSDGFKVTVNRRAVVNFKAHWPGSRLPTKGVVFQFAGNGDLVDITGEAGGSYKYDGEDLLALSQDAWAYVLSRYNVNPVKRSAEFAGYLQEDGTLLDLSGKHQLGTWQLNRTLDYFRPPEVLAYVSRYFEVVEFKTKKGSFAGGLSMGVGMLVRLQFTDGSPSERAAEARSYAEHVLARDIEDAEQQEQAGEE